MSFVIHDINFGITKWYLQPTFIVKIGSAVFSFILMVVLFVCVSRSADSLWKAVMGRTECIIYMILIILLIIPIITFLFYFYKIYPDHTTHLFFGSVISFILYTILFFIALIAFCTKSHSSTCTEKVLKYIQENNQTDLVLSFLSEYKDDIEKNGLNTTVSNYVQKRTTKNSSLLMPFSLIWTIFVAFLYFITLFESKDSDERPNSNIMQLHPNVES